MQKKESIKKEWNDAAESWVDFVRKGKDYTRYGLNSPATFELIGDANRLVVLDLACGEGYNTRILARKGAKVTGIDFSEKLIELARQDEAENKLGIRYFVLDAANLKGLPDNSFDLITCFMALQDIEHFEKAASEVSRVLKVGGRFVFSIPHPCFETIIIKGKRVNAAKRYFGMIKYPIQWNMERLSKPFRTTSFHRTLTDYFESLYLSKLFVRRLVEPKLSKDALIKYPYLRNALDRPQSVVVESVKCAHSKDIPQKNDLRKM